MALLLVSDVLIALPDGLRKPLLECFNEITKAYREGRWEPAELNGGKLSEVAYCILRGFVDGSYPSAPSKPSNMLDACKRLEQAPSSFPRSIRIQIPRMLVALYEIRNNRGVGHAGGDVNPNHMDAVVVVTMARWIVAELVRVFHSVSTDEATSVVDALVERTAPVIWQVGDQRRVLAQGLTAKQKVLLLLYGSSSAVSESALLRWTEYSNASNLRKDVLAQLHRERLVEYDRAQGRVHLSPLGVDRVERTLPLEWRPNK